MRIDLDRAAVMAVGCAAARLRRPGWRRALALARSARVSRSNSSRPAGASARTACSCRPATTAARRCRSCSTCTAAAATAAGQAANSRFEALAASEGLLVATLQAGAEGNRWNVPVTADRPDDVRYVSDVIDHVAARVCTDQARVYATGFSGGARMSSLLACKLNNASPRSRRCPACVGRVRARGERSPCSRSTGLADPQNTYDGHVEGRGGEWVESVPDALAGWAKHNGCDGDAEARRSAGAVVDAALLRVATRR